MKDKLRTIHVLNHVFSIPAGTVGSLNDMGAVYPCGSVVHDLHVPIDSLNLEHVGALFDAVIAGDRLARAVPQAAPDHQVARDAIKEGLKKYDEAKAETEESPRASITVGDIQRLALQPGDTIVLTPKDTMSDAAAKRLAKDIMAATGGNKVLILEPGMMIGTMGVDMGVERDASKIDFSHLGSAKEEIPLSPGDGAERINKPKPKAKSIEEATEELRNELNRSAEKTIAACKKARDAGVPFHAALSLMLESSRPLD